MLFALIAVASLIGILYRLYMIVLYIFYVFCALDLSHFQSCSDIANLFDILGL